MQQLSLWSPVTLAAAVAERDVLRMARYREYLAFYDGEQWSGRRRAGESRLTFNYARVLLRKSVAYLMPRPVTFDVLAEPGKPVSSAALRLAEQALAAAHEACGSHTVDTQAALDAAVLGDGAFKVSWDDAHTRPRIASVDPQTLWAEWEPGDSGTLTRVLQRYDQTPGEAARLLDRPIAVDGGRGRVTVVEEWTDARWRVEVDGELAIEQANPYGWIPYVLFPNVARPHEVWGASDLEDLIDVCRELNVRMTTIARILQVSGYPIAVLENVTGSEGIRAEPGAIWELPEDSKAYLLDMLGGGVGLHIQYVDLLYRQLHDLSETPRTAFGDAGRALSGVALEVEIQPLVQKVMRKRAIWDRVHRQRNALLLDLLERRGGLPLAGLRRTRAIWPEVLPSDRDALVANEARLVAAGIHSRRHALATLGDADPQRTWEETLAERAALRSAES